MLKCLSLPSYELRERRSVPLLPKWQGPQEKSLKRSEVPSRGNAFPWNVTELWAESCEVVLGWEREMIKRRWGSLTLAVDVMVDTKELWRWRLTRDKRQGMGSHGEASVLGNRWHWGRLLGLGHSDRVFWVNMESFQGEEASEMSPNTEVERVWGSCKLSSGLWITYTRKQGSMGAHKPLETASTWYLGPTAGFGRQERIIQVALVKYLITFF
jgi:hypothetical protein